MTNPVGTQSSEIASIVVEPPVLPEISPVLDGAGEVVSVHRGKTPTLAWGDGGTLWAAFEHEEHVYVARSVDGGATFGATVRVTVKPEPVETNGESRPKIAIGPGGEVYVSWTKKLAGRFTGEVRFTRSLDDGLHFEPVRAINDDGLAIGHRFESLIVDEVGDVYLSWIDKRDREAAKAEGETYRAAALYSAVSVDAGETFAANLRVADHACECCRVAMAEAPGGGAAILWRHVFEPSIRDHAFALLGPEGLRTEVERTSFEDWDLQGCPHHGPALERATESYFHATWFSAAADRPAIYYGRIDSRNGSVDQHLEVASDRAAYPDIVAIEDRVVVVWKRVDGEGSTIYQRRSSDGGVSWSEPEPILETAGGSDHPALLARGDEVFLGWHTAKDGLRVVTVL